MRRDRSLRLALSVLATWIVAVPVVDMVGGVRAAAATTTTITASPSPVNQGQSVTLTATTNAPGTVNFTYGGASIGTATTGLGAATATGYTQWGYTGNSISHRIATNPALSNAYVSTWNPDDCGGGRCQTKQLSPGGGVTYAPYESWNGFYVSITGLAVASDGTIYEGIFNGSAQNTIRKRTSISATSTTFVTSTSICGTCPAGSNYITGMTIDASNNLYVTNSRDGKILKVTPAGVVTDYATGLGSPIAGPVINPTTGVLYYIDGNKDIKQIPNGGGTPTLLTAANCLLDANPGSAWFGNGAQLALDSAGFIYGAQCQGVIPTSTPNNSPITQINPTSGAMREYLNWSTCMNGSLPNWAAGCGGNTALAFLGERMLTAGANMNNSNVMGMSTSGYVATLTYTPPAAGSYAIGAGLTPNDTNAFASSSGTGTLNVVPATPSAPDLAASSDLGTSSTDNLTSDATPTMTVPGTYADGTTITLTAARSGATSVTCSYTLPGQTSCDLPTLSAGTWSVTATQSVNGATSAASAALPLTVDTTAPGTPTGIDLATASDTGTSSSDNTTRTTTPTMSATGGAANDTMTITYTAPGVSYSCSYVLPATNCVMPTLPDGTYTATARLMDPAGNLSAVSASIPVTISTPPAVPVANADITHVEQGRTVTVAPLANDVAANVNFPLSTSSLKLCRSSDTPPNCAQTTVTVAGEGTYTLSGTSITFVPDGAFVNSSSMVTTSIRYVVTDSYTDVVSNTPIPSRVVSATVTIGMLPPPATSASPDSVTSTGFRVAATISPLDNDSAGTTTGLGGYTSVGSVALDNSTLKLCGTSDTPPTCNQTSVTISGQGTYALTGSNVTFTPVSTFFGNATGINYVVCNTVSGSWAPATPSSTCSTTTLSATIPAPTAPSSVSDTQGTPFNTAVNVAVLSNDTKDANVAWGNVRLCRAADTAPACGETSVTIAGQGTFAVDDATKRVVFTPATNYQGTTSSVGYVVLDELGAVTSSSLTVTVVASTIPFGVDLATASDSGISNSDDNTNDSTPTMSAGGGSNGDTMTLTATNGTTSVSCSYVLPATNCTMPPLADGVWNVSATLTTAGVVSAASPALPLTIDTSGPSGLALDLATSSDSGASSTDDVTNDTTPTMSVPGTATGDEVTVTATPSGGGTPVTCSYTVGVATGCTLGALADGNWSMSASITDLAGNTGTTGSLPVSIDTSAPAAPSAPDLAAASDLGASDTDDLTSDSTPRIDVPGGTNGDTMTVTATPSGGGAPVSCTFVVGQATGCDLPTLADGQWAVSATLTDPAGNTSPSTAGPTLSIDTVPPGSPGAPDLAAASDTGSSSTDDLTTDSTPRIDVPGGTNGDTMTVTATPSGGGAPVSCTFVVGQATGCDLPALTDGQWAVSATLTDPAGNTSMPTTGPTLSIDATAPTPSGLDLDAASDTGPSDSDNNTSDNTPTVSAGGGANGDTVTITATNGSSTVSCTFVVPATSCTLGTLTDGTWNVSATITDGMGNVSPPASGPALVIDTVAPVAPGAPDLAPSSDNGSSNSDNDTSDTTPTFGVPGAIDGGRVTVSARNENGTLVTCTFVKSNAVDSCDLATLTIGTWIIDSTITDAAGNSSPAGSTMTLVIRAASVMLASTGLRWELQTFGLWVLVLGFFVVGARRTRRT